MTSNSISDPDDWRARRSLRRRRLALIWVGSPVLALLAAIAMLSSAHMAAPAVTIALRAFGLAGIVLAFAIGSIGYMQSVDELEREAQLWGHYVALHVAVAAVMVWWMCRVIGIMPPIDPFVIAGIGVAGLVGGYLWRRFRWGDFQ